MPPDYSHCHLLGSHFRLAPYLSPVQHWLDTDSKISTMTTEKHHHANAMPVVSRKSRDCVRSRRSLCILDLPGELRNAIYEFALSNLFGRSILQNPQLIQCTTAGLNIPSRFFSRRSRFSAKPSFLTVELSRESIIIACHRLPKSSIPRDEHAKAVRTR